MVSRLLKKNLDPISSGWKLPITRGSFAKFHQEGEGEREGESKISRMAIWTWFESWRGNVNWKRILYLFSCNYQQETRIVWKLVFLWLEIYFFILENYFSDNKNRIGNRVMEYNVVTLQNYRWYFNRKVVISFIEDD